MKKKILFVGDHPLGLGGNSNMMKAVLSQVDQDRYEFAVCSVTEAKLIPDLMTPLPFPVYTPLGSEDNYGNRNLLRILSSHKVDAVVSVGIDIWMIAPSIKGINQIRSSTGLRSAGIFPYDLMSVRGDYVDWIKSFDIPCVYSSYAKSALQNHIPNLRYFRPPLYGAEFYTVYGEAKRRGIRNRKFADLGKDSFIFGWVGNNQFRKDPQLFIKAFSEVKKKLPQAVMYFHTNLHEGVYNLPQYMLDVGCATGDVLVKKAAKYYTMQDMADIYNSLDCLVNTSMQEGLSWTLLEAMLCGCPVIASDTTSQKELLTTESGEIVGFPVRMGGVGYLPVLSTQGPTWVESKHCDLDHLVSQMLYMARNPKEVAACREAGAARAKSWLEKVSNINNLLDELVDKPRIEVVKEDAVLFAQRSSGGDVFMTTRCFKGLKDRHENKPIDYMTEEPYMDIIKGNPYIRKIIPWNDAVPYNYTHYYNPHAERILPGHWGRNSNSLLSDFYWKILKVDPCDFFIEQAEPEVLKASEIPSNICILHTTGGDPHYRTYKFMEDVATGLNGKYFTIQLGGRDDFPAGATWDLRGQLSFRESAWVMARAKMAVTVDSFISHLAGALGVNQVCLFGSGNFRVVRPNQLGGRLACLFPDYIRDCKGLGPCSASVRDCPTPCTGIHDPKDILNTIEALEKGEEYEPVGSCIEYV